MKIRSARPNNRKRAFEVVAGGRRLDFPYAKTDPVPGTADAIVEVFVDEELGREAFTYRLASGREGSVHVDRVLEYHQDPSYMRDLLLYQLTIESQKRIEDSPLAKREIIRRLGTSAAQFYRLLDPTNYRKSIDQMILLLRVLDCDVDLVVRDKTPMPAAGKP